MNKKSDPEIIPMIGMTLDDWRSHLGTVMQHQAAEAELRKRIVEEIRKKCIKSGSSAECDRLIEFLDNYSLASDRYSRAIRILLQYLPRVLTGGLGQQVHLLASVSREFPIERDLIYEALSKIMKD